MLYFTLHSAVFSNGCFLVHFQQHIDDGIFTEKSRSRKESVVKLNFKEVPFHLCRF